jgi:hypothetical protein
LLRQQEVFDSKHIEEAKSNKQPGRLAVIVFLALLAWFLFIGGAILLWHVVT